MTLIADASHALRSLRHRPGFTAVALLTIGIAIAANTTMFSVVYGTLLRPLPYRDSFFAAWASRGAWSAGRCSMISSARSVWALRADA
jgi:hypothetical protein